MGRVTAAKPDVTRLLNAWRGGRQDALDELLHVVYGELRRLARGQLAGQSHHTLQATELVHEAFVRLVDQRVPWQSRAHFFGIATTCMRRVLGDYARRRKATKRPQIDRGVEVEQIDRGVDSGIDRLIALDEAIEFISRSDVRRARVVELKLFASLENAEIAEVLGVSAATVQRDWQDAKPVLQRILVERSRDAR